jgi:replicative superfamily II helicase
MQEAVKWLSYTYLFVRMRKNPLLYGMDWNATQFDPQLGQRILISFSGRHEILAIAAAKLHKAQMIVFDERTGYLISKDLGRISSNYYIRYNCFTKAMQL